MRVTRAESARRGRRRVSEWSAVHPPQQWVERRRRAPIPRSSHHSRRRVRVAPTCRPPAPSPPSEALASSPTTPPTTSSPPTPPVPRFEQVRASEPSGGVRPLHRSGPGLPQLVRIDVIRGPLDRMCLEGPPYVDVLACSTPCGHPQPCSRPPSGVSRGTGLPLGRVGRRWRRAGSVTGSAGAMVQLDGCESLPSGCHTRIPGRFRTAHTSLLTMFDALPFDSPLSPSSCSGSHRDSRRMGIYPRSRVCCPVGCDPDTACPLVLERRICYRQQRLAKSLQEGRDLRVAALLRCGPTILPDTCSVAGDGWVTARTYTGCQWAGVYQLVVGSVRLLAAGRLQPDRPCCCSAGGCRSARCWRSQRLVCAVGWRRLEATSSAARLLMVRQRGSRS